MNVIMNTLGDFRTIVCLYLTKREESSMQGKVVISQAINDIL